MKAHFFLSMLAYYVEWQMRRDLAPMLFEDEELPSARWTRDPVAPARASESARAKKAGRRTEEGLEVHSFNTLLTALATQCRNTCRTNSDGGPTFIRLTDPTPLQSRACQLLGL
ncbi:MAG: hypothetical protein ACP5VF_11665 [Acidobacteriota bacterium]